MIAKALTSGLKKIIFETAERTKMATTPFYCNTIAQTVYIPIDLAAAILFSKAAILT